jgi:hypothetical protein
MKAEDGKMRMTDVADTEEVLRLIQWKQVPHAHQQTTPVDEFLRVAL